MKYRWTWRGLATEEEIAALARATGMPKGIAAILAARGIRTPEAAQRFLHPSAEQLHSPWLFHDMEAAVARLERARYEQELVWVHGDYDVDGTASTAVLVDFLSRWGLQVRYHVPDRFQEGYGLTVEGVERAVNAGATLIVAVDSGINAAEAVAYARERGADVIICDHHEPTGPLPEATAILNPRLADSGFPFPLLAACGVVFKLVWAAAQRWGEPEQAFEYLDLVALATVADLVPLVEENRVLTALGLQRIRTQPRPGLLGLLQCVGMPSQNVTTADILLALAPRINAAGRLGDARRAVELLLQTDEGVAFRIAQELECENFRRRTIAEQVYAEAIGQAEELLTRQGYRSVVLYNPQWHPGVLGIVATRIAERFQVPVILLSRVGGFVKGSARSGGAVNLLELLAACSAHTCDYGGHPFAAGVVLREDQVGAFSEAVERFASQSELQPAERPELRVDAVLDFAKITPQFLLLLRRLAPFGYENFRPVFLAHRVRLHRCRSDNSCRLEQQGVWMDGVLNGVHYLDVVGERQPLSILYTLEERGGTERQAGVPVIHVRDFCLDSERPCLK
ncbi:MAG: single-stranded-DNA-specific exonuclease RecJ [Candidatus Kapabacteria bacterium]|nr:single-stranded-DNA-specific exonuclease RecJ [Candidatus Kapabacteria bacterium]MDW8012976.1 single-stranded-DNA-specific exonuclease RecJ [Bacteroidota bacterium]